MPSIINVLKDSLTLLRERPRFFVPKLLSTSLGAVWFIGLVSRTGPLYLYALTGLPLAALALFVSVMLAAMVERSDSDSLLTDGFRAALERRREVMLGFLGFMLVALLVYVPAASGIVLYYLGSSYLFLLAGVFLSLALLLAFGFVSYFFPVSLLEKEAVGEGFMDSARTSMDNAGQVLPLTLLSFALLALASFTPDAGMRYLGYAGFVAMRLLSGVATTYIFVVSPNYYLKS